MKQMIFSAFDTAFRGVTLFSALILFGFLMIAGARIAFAATLRAEAILTKDTLTVGDIFDNAGKNADYILGPSPKPGSSMTLNAPTLLRVAMALDLPWTPESSGDQIVVSRASAYISSDMVKDQLVSALKQKGVGDRFMVDTGSTPLDINLSPEYPATIEITNVTYNPGSSRFEAIVSAPSAAKPIKQMNVSGQVRSMIDIPVLKTSLRNGNLISESDISYIEIYASDIQPDMLLNASDLTGMTPRRMVMAGKPVRTIDLQAPQLVGRGESVTVTYADGIMQLTTMGRALQNGAKGDLIRVVNNTSNRPLDAIVDGSGSVIIKQ